MTDSKSPLRDGACFAALKDAILAEQHVLELDIHIVSARVKALLGEPLFETVPASAPIVMPEGAVLTVQVENKPLEATLNRPRGGRVCPPFRKRQRALASRSVQASHRCHNWAAKATSSARAPGGRGRHLS